MTSGPNYNEDPDTEGKTVPPYEGRKTPVRSVVRRSPRTTRPGPEARAAPPRPTPGPRILPILLGVSTPRRPTNSPHQRLPRPGSLMAGTRGTAHEPGTGRAEDRRRRIGHRPRPGRVGVWLFFSGGRNAFGTVFFKLMHLRLWGTLTD